MTNEAIMQALQPVLQTVLVAIATIIAAAIVKALSKLSAKLGLQTDAEQEARAERVVREAVFSVAEFASKRLLEGVKLPAKVKLDRAILIARAELPNMPADKLETMIYAALARYGLAADAKVRTGETPTPRPADPDDPMPPLPRT